MWPGIQLRRCLFDEVLLNGQMESAGTPNLGKRNRGPFDNGGLAGKHRDLQQAKQAWENRGRSQAESRSKLQRGKLPEQVGIGVGFPQAQSKRPDKL